MIRTRFAPSPTGFMHIGNLRTALYEYLIAKSGGGSFILRIEDTDRERLVEGSLELIYKTLEKTGLKHDEGPDVGGNYGPYVQSERKGHYLAYAEDLVKNGTAYYCFCPKERLESLHDNSGNGKYDRHCLSLSKEEIAENLKNNVPYVIRQLIPDGNTTFHDEVFGDITVDNSELDDMILIKSDGYPTYNFANVIDDHLMEITHVIRGSEYLSSTPKYNLLYNAFGWDIPTYIHLPLILNSNGEKLSKRRGDASFEDLVKMGYLPEAIINYIALLGWSPNNNREIFSLQELTEVFSISGLSKSPSTFDLTKLTWMNGEYFKKMETENFLSLAEPLLKEGIKREDIDLLWLCNMLKTRVEFVSDIADMIDFIDKLPDYSPELYVHKKMKTTLENSKESLEKVLPLLREAEDWTLEALHEKIMNKIKELDIKNGQMLWPIRTALSGKPTSPCGATELAVLLGKDETLRRIEKGIEVLS